MLQPFITPDQLKGIAAISSSIETDFLTPFILTTQTMTVEPILGIALSTQISNQLISGTTTPQNELLINDYILPFLGYATWSQSAAFLSIKAYKKSLVRPVDPNSEALSDDSIRFYKANIDTMANFFKEKLFKFLEADAQLPQPIYPLYRSTNSEEFRASGQPAAGFFMTKKYRGWNRYPY